MSKYCMKCMERLDDSGVCTTCGAWKSPVQAAHLLIPGTVLDNRWLIGNVLGQGGFGITYIGRDLLLDSRIAVKEFYPDERAFRNTGVSDKISTTGGKAAEDFERGKERFLDEARTLARYHEVPGVVHVLNFFKANDTAYIVMEYLDGIDLQHRLDSAGKFPANWVFTRFLPIMDALEAIHADHFVHRDVTPDNIMLLKDGTLRLMDFGAARTIIPESPENHTVMIKTGYAPEEQYTPDGNQGPWTDIYALCATMYTCITGIVPPNAIQRRNSDCDIWPSAIGIDISPEYEAILKKGMAIEPENRFQSIDEMRKAIVVASNGMPGQANGNASNSDENRTRKVTRQVDPAASRGNGVGAIPAKPRAFCTKCGTPLGPDDNFCRNCRQPVAKIPEGEQRRQPPKGNKGGRNDKGKGKGEGKRTGIILAAVFAALAIVLGALFFTGAFEQLLPDNETGGTTTKETTVTVKNHLEDYSWEELSQISQEIAKAEDTGSALEVAKTYNLVDNDGKLDGTQTKMVSLDGSSEPVHIIGFAHDKTADGNVVGLTFQFVNCIDTHAMNYPLASDEAIQDYADERNVSVSVILRDHPDGVPTNVGGWEGSDMRKWLLTDILPQLPTDLRNAIVSVEKKTDNVGKTTDTDSVTATSDELWLPSKVEVCGTKGLKSAVTKKEGKQYQLFKDTGVSATASSNSSLKKVLGKNTPCDWWLRTPAPQTAFHFTRVSEDGDLNGRTNYADVQSGVSPCFCI